MLHETTQLYMIELIDLWDPKEESEMTKVQMEERIKDLEGQVLKTEAELNAANLLKDVAMKEHDAQEKKIKNLKAVLKDLLINEPVEDEV